MKMRAAMIGTTLLAVAACSTGTGAARSFDDPVVQKLYNMPTPQYFATVKLASQIAQNCARYRFDSILDVELNQRRNEVGRGTLSALSLGDAIEIESDVAGRSFVAKHGVELTGADLCPAADAETAEGGAVSALLVPV